MSGYVKQGDCTNFANEAKMIYWKRAISGSEQLKLLMNAQQERKKEMRNRDFFQVSPVFRSLS